MSILVEYKPYFKSVGIEVADIVKGFCVEDEEFITRALPEEPKVMLLVPSPAEAIDPKVTVTFPTD